MDSLGIYISVPFCRSKCTYCNFASGVHPEALHEQYISRLCHEIEKIRVDAARWGGEIPPVLDSLYLGGGTPSVLAPVLMDRLWHTLRQQFDFVKTPEITMECAPGQLDNAMLEAMPRWGVNRVSFGVQSFVDREAAATGRLHNREVALADVRRVQAAGIRSVNVDLIAGLPHQDPISWRDSLQTLTGSDVGHASVYMLEIDEDSRLGRELLANGSRYHASTAPDDEMTASFYEEAIAWLEAEGLSQYEISNFSCPADRSLHNEKYWKRRPYLGFGLDAHSMLRTSRGSALRFANLSSLDDYLRAPAEGAQANEFAILQPGARAEFRELTRQEELEEAWFLGLRLAEGVAWRTLAAEFGESALAPFRAVVDELNQLELLACKGDNIRLTRRGLLLSNEVFARFMGLDCGPDSKPHEQEMLSTYSG